MLHPTRPRNISADEDLISLVHQSRDSHAFATLYDRHGRVAYSLAYRMMGERQAAEDLAQDAFLKLWRAAGSYRAERGSVRTWLLGIVHNRGIDALRRNLVHERRRVSAEGIEERHEARELTDVEAARRIEARTVRSALETLPNEQLRVVELAYFGGFTHTEIADLLELPVGTVKGRMRLGLGKLRLELGGIAA